MRPPSLDMWRRIFSVIAISWMAMQTSLMFFIPRHLATLSHESLASSLASRVAVNYVQPVYDSVGSFGNTLASGYGWIASSVAQERSAVEATLLDSTFFANTDIISSTVDNPAIGTERELGLLDVLPETTFSRIRRKVTSATTPIVLAIAYLPDLSSLPPKTSATIRKYRHIVNPMYYGILAREVVIALQEHRQTGHWFASIAYAHEAADDLSCLCDSESLSAAHVTEKLWKHASRIFRRYLAYFSTTARYSSSPADQRLLETPSPCRCESATMAPVVQEQGASKETHHPAPDPQMASSQRRAVKVSGRSDDTASSLSNPWPVLRVHDCGMDDPNWHQGIFFSAKSQSRKCKPTYESWEMQPQSPTQATEDCLDGKSRGLDTKCLSERPESQDSRNPEPLVYGFPSDDPRNQYVNRDAAFKPCRKGALQTLTISKGKTLRECLLDKDFRFQSTIQMDDEELTIAKRSATAEATGRHAFPAFLERSLYARRKTQPFLAA
ncbi:hypothetical protein NCC49_005959 [Naganishia albida]|nr:hypothetical protein NCC49_005959 [Naganishia albida]